MYIYELFKNKIDNLKQKKIQNKLKTVEIYDIETLSYDLRDIQGVENAFQNDCYGVASNLKAYAGVEKERVFNFIIEHGIYMLKGYVYEIDIIHHTPIVTVGNFRKKYLEEVWKKEVYAIGPYIAYAKGYYSEERVLLEKSHNGKTLLVFPPHSTLSEEIDYERRDFINEIERLRKGFDTVLVCMYYVDVQKGFHDIYKKKGYKVVCAGHGSDELFLNRLRTIIELSDAVLMNVVMPALAYAVYLKKPCYVYSQKLDYRRSAGTFERYIEKIPEWYELEEMFSDDRFILTKEQEELCENVYSFKEVKSREELKEIIMKYSKV